MKLPIKFIPGVVVLCLLAGCATQQNYALAVASWRGARVAQLQQVWGYPNRIMKIRSGHKLYVYRTHIHGRTPVITMPGYTSVSSSNNTTTIYQSSPTISGGESYDLSCTTWFEINTRGVVVNSRFRGNDCTGTQNFLQMYRKPIQVNPV